MMAGVAAIDEERRIVVAVDESEESLYALRWCLRNLIPVHARNTLFLLYARPTPPLFTVLDGDEFIFSEEEIASMEQHSKEVSRSVLEKAENICKSYNNIKFEGKECRGDARDVICDMVEKLNADMLVIGSHGYGFIKRAFLGSVSNYCAQNAKCPVVIVKRPAQ